MLKQLVLLLVFLVGTHLANMDNTQLKKANSSFVEDLPVLEVFQLDANGEDMVDTVVNSYNKSGALINQWVYYLDGRVALFDSYLTINDLNLRQYYMDYKNAHMDYNLDFLKSNLKVILKELNPSKEERIIMADMIAFNSYLCMINEEEYVFADCESYIELMGINDTKHNNVLLVILLFTIFAALVYLLKLLVEYVSYKTNKKKLGNNTS